jgi:malate synthase
MLRTPSVQTRHVEDANTPHWTNVISSQVALAGAVGRRLTFRYGRELLDVPLGTIRATVFIDTLGCLRDGGDPFRAARPRVRAQAGRWDYLSHLEAWLGGGNGAVGIQILMEDAATAEISRPPVWHNVRLDTGETATAELVRRSPDEELAAIRVEIGDQAFGSSRFDDARQLFEQVARLTTLLTS